jgi:hypothetical protein
MVFKSCRAFYIYLEISINQPVSFKVVIVFAKRIDQTFGHFQPSHVEEKLDTRQTQKEKSDLVLRPLQLNYVEKQEIEKKNNPYLEKCKYWNVQVFLFANELAAH